MKRGIAIIIFLILSFTIHAIYMGHFNENFFKELSKNDNKNYQITDIQFHKGFLNSHGQFTVKNDYLKFSTQVNLKLNNSFFTADIVEGNLSSPFDFLDQFASFVIKSNNNDKKLLLNIKDINLSDKGGDTIIDGGKIEATINKNLKIKNVKIFFENVNFSQFYTRFILKNLHYEQTFKNPTNLYGLNFLTDSGQELSFDYFEFNSNKISFFQSKNQLQFNQNNSFFNLHVQGKSNEIDINLKNLFAQNLNFEKANFDFNFKKSLDKINNFFQFFQEDLVLKIHDLNLEKNNQIINTKGQFNIDGNKYQAKLQILTSKEPDGIFTWAKNYGGLNQYFFKEDDNFILNLTYDSSTNPQLKINGNEFSNMDLN